MKKFHGNNVPILLQIGWSGARNYESFLPEIFEHYDRDFGDFSANMKIIEKKTDLEFLIPCHNNLFNSLIKTYYSQV